MSKRTAADSADAPPALRIASASAGAAYAAGAVVDSFLRRAHLSVRRAAHSFRLAELLRANKPVDDKLAAVAASLLEDAARPETLIHLSMQFQVRRWARLPMRGSEGQRSERKDEWTPTDTRVKRCSTVSDCSVGLRHGVDAADRRAGQDQREGLGR